MSCMQQLHDSPTNSVDRWATCFLLNTVLESQTRLCLSLCGSDEAQRFLNICACLNRTALNKHKGLASAFVYYTDKLFKVCLFLCTFSSFIWWRSSNHRPVFSIIWAVKNECFSLAFMLRYLPAVYFRQLLLQYWENSFFTPFWSWPFPSPTCSITE